VKLSAKLVEMRMLFSLGLIYVNPFIPDEVAMLIIPRMTRMQDRDSLSLLALKIDFIILPFITFRCLRRSIPFKRGSFFHFQGLCHFQLTIEK